MGDDVALSKLKPLGGHVEPVYDDDDGKILRGVVHRCFMKNTITIRRDYLHYITKYRRYEKRHKMISAHCSPAFDVRPGDEVMIGECRPLSKTVRFNVLEVHEKVSRNTGGKVAK